MVYLYCQCGLPRSPFYFIIRVLFFFLPFPFRYAESFLDESELFPDFAFDVFNFETWTWMPLLLESLEGTFLDKATWAYSRLWWLKFWMRRTLAFALAGKFGKSFSWSNWAFSAFPQLLWHWMRNGRALLLAAAVTRAFGGSLLGCTGDFSRLSWRWMRNGSSALSFWSIYTLTAFRRYWPLPSTFLTTLIPFHSIYYCCLWILYCSILCLSNRMPHSDLQRHIFFEANKGKVR